MPRLLFRALKSIGRTAKRFDDRDTSSPPEESIGEAQESPPARFARLNRAHGAAPTEAHLDILYSGLRVSDQSLLDLVARCLSESNTHSAPGKVLHRPLASYFLARYFLHALEVEGCFGECGVFRGASALLACRVAQTRDAAYAGTAFHLIDSFEGLDQPADEDRFAMPAPTGEVARVAYTAGGFAASEQVVRATLKDFPEVAYHRGWIPAVFKNVPEARWSYVHLDVDHYEPTYASLGYFHPRLARGGVIICDDYGSPLFPGAHRAWDRYCEEHDLPYVVLDTGQSVLLKA